ncbi:hypothetical protein SG34_004965 [Thalassomonas viridans]|uniref:Secreted protein n=1 Tax=Thalassomonas viridans TaxID=137584 RepID=A0AAE9Z6Q8_9GAMM|nr:hypothetical protein [Thalassomonas viridans]WDE06278.1 hypothetical protein SG34_004965 [Thalassomonas viridans]
MKNSLIASMVAMGMFFAGTLTSAPANAFKDPDSVVYHVACYSGTSFQWYELADTYAEARIYQSLCSSQGGTPKITILL